MLENIKYGITHGGRFHTDDVVSSVFIRRLNNNIKISRVFIVTEEMKKNKENIIYDIGGGKFDHHQEDVDLNDRGDRYSAFGLLWREYGKSYLQNLGFKHIDEAFEEFKNQVVYKIDRGDNYGYQESEDFYENTIVKSFDLKWYEKSSDDLMYQQFEKACNFVNLIWDNWFRNIYQEIEAIDIENNIWNKAISNVENNAIYLEEYIPWEHHILEHPELDIHYIVMKSIRGGFVVRSTDTEKYPVMPNQYMSFVHASRFMGVAETIDLAKLAIKYLEKK